MSYYIYSHESIPNQNLVGKPGYTPEYIIFNGIQLPPIQEKTWTQLPDNFPKYTRDSWVSPKKHERVFTEDFKGILTDPQSRWVQKGVVFLDHEPTERERQKYARASEQNNLDARAKAIEFFESERTNALARQGRYEASAYVNECYEILGVQKPYSTEAFMAQRDPGGRAAERISTAMAEAQRETAKAVVEAIRDVLVPPEFTPKTPAELAHKPIPDAVTPIFTSPPVVSK